MTDTRKALETSIAVAMEAAGINHPALAAKIALNEIGKEFLRRRDDAAALSEISMVFMGDDE